MHLGLVPSSYPGLFALPYVKMADGREQAPERRDSTASVRKGFVYGQSDDSWFGYVRNSSCSSPIAYS